MRFSVYQLTRQGGRVNNEDGMGYCYTRQAGLFVVADGMGGHPEGEVASQMALQVMAKHFERECLPTVADPVRFLKRATLAAHRKLRDYAAQREMSDTPRTTVVACLLQNGAVYWAHCGDSRLYLMRGEALLARTRDHSYSELQAAKGPVRRQQPVNRNVLYTCLGGPVEPVVDTHGPFALEAGDRVLLCSDGLWDNVSDLVIARELAAAAIDRSVPSLVAMAERGGGVHCDNVTALAIEWEGDEALPAAIPHPAAGDEGFASTLQWGDATAMADTLPLERDEALLTASDTVFDDAALDRSIDEINEAIRRAAFSQHARGEPTNH